MAKPTTLRFSNLRVYLGDGSTPEVFTVPCGFTQKSLKLTATTSEAILPDCDTPEAPAAMGRAVTATSAQVSGSGVLALESLAAWRAWWKSGASKNIRVEFNAPKALGGGHYEGPAVLVDLTFNTQLNSEGNRVQVSVQIDSDGDWAWVPAAA